MKKAIISISIVAMAFVCVACGSSGSSGGGGGGSTCARNTSCCSGAGYSNDGGTSCYLDAACSTACASTCVTNQHCCSGSGYTNDGGTTCFQDSTCSSGCSGTNITALKITNTNSSAVTIGFVSAAYGGACLEGELLTAKELSDAGWCTSYEAGVSGAGKCLVTLGAAGSHTASVFVPNPDNKCISGSFGTGGFASCQTSTYPDGWTQGEFTLNPKETTQEAVDISAVNGVNYELSIVVDDSQWLYEDGTALTNNTVGPNQALNQNIGVHGVFPASCTDCIQLVGTIPCTGLTPDPPNCDATRMCNVYRNNSPGGVVEFKIGPRLDQ